MKTYQKSFAAGEICPALYGRVDLAKYSTGVRTMRNMFVARHGGAYNRPGTSYRTVIKDSTHRARLFRFQSTTGKHFQIEIGHLYIRILAEGRPQQLVPKTIVSILKGTTTSYFTNTPHAFKVGDQVTLSGGSVAAYNVVQTITVVGATSFTTSLNSSAFANPAAPFGTATIVTNRNVELVAPWTEAQLREMTYVQDGNILNLVHSALPPQDLIFLTDDAWLLSATSTEPRIAAPTGLALSVATGSVFYYGVTAVDPVTFEESYVSATIGSGTAASVSTTVVLSWTPVIGVQQYNVYGGVNPGTLGFRSVVYTAQFNDNGSLFADYTNPPPASRPPFVTTGMTAYPAAVGAFQQRRFYGNIGPEAESVPLVLPSGVSFRAPDRVIASRIGSANYYALRRPTGDDDALFFRMLHRRPQTIRHFLDIGKLAVFTEQGEWVLGGGDQGAITPSQINPTNVSQNGSGFVAPVQIQNSAIYLQNKGSLVRTFAYEFQIEGYKGDDLTVFAAHLVENKTIVAWDYVKLPHPILWSARSDGKLLGLTMVPEQAIYAWHQHDFTNGFVEDVVESDDRIYLIIRRFINGATVRYVERLTRRDFVTIKDAIFMDSAVSYNGVKTDGSTVTVSGGTTWDNGDLLTITCSAPNFTAQTAAIHYEAADGHLYRFTSISYVSPTVVTGTPERLIPPAIRNLALLNWVDARSIITGLSSLEGQQVSVIGDGFVVANPNNDDYPVLTVTAGQINLGDTAYGRVHVGLPIVADLETLNIDTAQGESILDRKKLITKVSMWVEATRGVWVGGVPPDDDSQDPLQGLTTGFNELKARYDEGYDEPNHLVTRVVEINLQSQWNSHGRVFVRQIDPLPLGVLSIAPTGLIPFAGG